jgi:hypothetical protein
MSANDAQRTESIYNISDFEFFEIGEFTTEAQSRRGEYFTTENKEHKVFAIFRISISKQSERRNDVNRAPRASLQHRLQSPVCSLCLRGPCFVNFRI